MELLCYGGRSDDTGVIGPEFPSSAGCSTTQPVCGSEDKTTPRTPVRLRVNRRDNEVSCLVASLTNPYIFNSVHKSYTPTLSPGSRSDENATLEYAKKC